MRKHLRRIIAMGLTIAMVSVTSATCVRADEPSSNGDGNSSSVSSEEIDNQKVVEAIGDAVEHMGDPEEFIAWVSSELFKEILKTNPLPGQMSEAEQISLLLEEMNAALSKLDSISQEIASTTSVEMINNFKLFDAADNTNIYVKSFGSIDKSDALPEAKAESRKKMLVYNLTETAEGSPVQDELYSTAYDGSYDKYKAFALTQFETVKSEELYIIEMYDKLLRVNKKWYNQYYKEKASFQNYIIGKYYTVATLEELSLIARIQAYENQNNKSADILREKYNSIVEDVKAAKKLYASQKAFEPDPQKRYYMYPGNEKVIWATAKEQTIPCEPNRDKGDEDQFEWLRDGAHGESLLAGITWKKINANNFEYYPKLSFWRSFISYNNSLCPTKEWYEQVYKDYGSNKPLYDIFFDENEGNLTKPNEVTSSWLFVADPDNQSPMIYQSNTFTADYMQTPAVSSNGKCDYHIIYKYHAFSNEPATDKRYIGIGIVDDAPIKEDEENKEYGENDSDSDKNNEGRIVDYDTYKSELPSRSVLMINTANTNDMMDMKVHALDAKTQANQTMLADYYAKKADKSKKANILASYGIYTRATFPSSVYGTKRTLTFANLNIPEGEKVYAVCYNETDKNYLLEGSMIKGYAVFNGIIVRDATNITIYVLK